MNSKLATKTQLVGGLLVANGRVLLCHRTHTRDWYPDAWDLPGGHVESNETSTQALVREIREELAVEIPEPTDPPIAHFVTPDADRRIWVVTKWVGYPVNAAPDEHNTIEWFDASSISSDMLAHPNYTEIILQVLDRRPRDY